MAITPIRSLSPVGSGVSSPLVLSPEEKSPLTSLRIIPLSVWQKIFSILSTRDQARTLLVCRKWQKDFTPLHGQSCLVHFAKLLGHILEAKKQEIDLGAQRELQQLLQEVKSFPQHTIGAFFKRDFLVPKIFTLMRSCAQNSPTLLQGIDPKYLGAFQITLGSKNVQQLIDTLSSVYNVLPALEEAEICEEIFKLNRQLAITFYGGTPPLFPSYNARGAAQALLTLVRNEISQPLLSSAKTNELMLRLVRELGNRLSVAAFTLEDKWKAIAELATFHPPMLMAELSRMLLQRLPKEDGLFAASVVAAWGHFEDESEKQALQSNLLKEIPNLANCPQKLHAMAFLLRSLALNMPKEELQSLYRAQARAFMQEEEAPIVKRLVGALRELYKDKELPAELNLSLRQIRSLTDINKRELVLLNIGSHVIAKTFIPEVKSKRGQLREVGPIVECILNIADLIENDDLKGSLLLLFLDELSKVEPLSHLPKATSLIVPAHMLPISQKRRDELFRLVAIHLAAPSPANAIEFVAAIQHPSKKGEAFANLHLNDLEGESSLLLPIRDRIAQIADPESRDLCARAAIETLLDVIEANFIFEACLFGSCLSTSKRRIEEFTKIFLQAQKQKLLDESLVFDLMSHLLKISTLSGAQQEEIVDQLLSELAQAAVVIDNFQFAMDLIEGMHNGPLKERLTQVLFSHFDKK